jgi:hypothetical protein
MDAKQLRIGNYVKFGKLFKKVVEIAEEGFYILDKDGTTLKNTWADLQPIPLTQEWLMKFGFDEKEPVLISSWKFSPFCETIITKCEYVHQLQNLYFALTGKELVVSDAVS